MPEFTMPQLGESVVEGTITRWLKSEGDSVEADEAIVEISTDKVDSEIPSPMSGTLTSILVAEGETVAVGAAIAEIATGDAAAPVQEDAESAGTGAQPEATQPAAAPPAAAPPAAAPPAAAPPAAAPPAGGRGEAAPGQQPSPATPSDGGAGADSGTAEQSARPDESRAPDKGPPPPGTGASSSGNGSSPAPAESGRRVLSPLVRKLASEKKVDLSSVAGTGPGGRVTKQDVLDAAERPSGPAGAPGDGPPAPRRPGGSDEVVPVTTMRRVIAEHMVSSHTETARAWNTIEVDMSAVGRLRKQAAAAFKKAEGYSLTWTPFVSKALCTALLEFPQVNSTWNGDGTITRKHYVNLGIAVALDNGLIVPVIKGADQMNILGLARTTRDLADRARTKKLSPDEVTEGTFTLTNPGPFGTVMSLPIINKGQAAILAFDAIVKRPVVITDENGDDSIAIRERVFLSLSWDHRIIDGAEAGRFLHKLRMILEEDDFSSDLEAFLPG